MAPTKFNPKGKCKMTKQLVTMRFQEQPDGRYVLANDELAHRLEIRISEADRKQLDEAAEATGLSVSQVARYGIALAYQQMMDAVRHGEPVPPYRVRDPQRPKPKRK